ncbi:MAG TPA: hypothetical protein VNZ86_05420 [Bacteroidia bacterium]|nr:hypothetical protein [Bacteroidia bacterium]
MATYKDFAISGVWFMDNVKDANQISHVMLHKISKHNMVLKGEKTEKDKIVELLLTKMIYTLKWNYREGRWKWGVPVEFEIRDEITHLQTRSEGDPTCRIENLMNMNILMAANAKIL